MKHTCEKDGRSNCAPCMQFETGLWDAINRYASSVGGDPSEHVHDNERRMQAVADVGRLISQQRAAVGQLREVLAAVRDFLRGTSRRHTHTVVAIVDGVLNEVGSVNPRGPASPTNPNCTGTVGKDFLPCGEEGYYCSDRCWTIGRLRAAREQVLEYERQLGVCLTGSSDPAVPQHERISTKDDPP